MGEHERATAARTVFVSRLATSLRMMGSEIGVCWAALFDHSFSLLLPGELDAPQAV